MAGKSVSFNANFNVEGSYAEEITKWLSCNGEAWGVGPTAVFAAAAALFLHHELHASLLAPGDQPHVSTLEKSLIVAMVAGMLALMVHVWVCLMRFFQYYLDTLIRESPNVLLEMTTAGLLGAGQAELAALGPLTRFLRQQQPQIHITVCWLLALCYADYVRKHCCRFNVPYLEQWQAELHAQARRRVRSAVASAGCCVDAVHARLRGFAPPPAVTEVHTVSPARGARRGLRRTASAGAAACAAATAPARPSRSPARRPPPPQTPSRSSERISRPPAVPALHRAPATPCLPSLRHEPREHREPLEHPEELEHREPLEHPEELEHREPLEHPEQRRLELCHKLMELFMRLRRASVPCTFSLSPSRSPSSTDAARLSSLFTAL